MGAGALVIGAVWLGSAGGVATGMFGVGAVAVVDAGAWLVTLVAPELCTGGVATGVSLDVVTGVAGAGAGAGAWPPFKSSSAALTIRSGMSH